VGEVSDRASLARWNWKARNARATLSAMFTSHGYQLVGEWCDFEQSTRLSESAARLGPSPTRTIQRWDAKQSFIAAADSCIGALDSFERLYVHIMDAPDAGWIHVPSDHVLSKLARAASEWLTDGFIAFDPESESLLSVDVEEMSGTQFIESTVIGNKLTTLRDYFKERGPQPLEIFN
jgi:hypothetical protein